MALPFTKTTTEVVLLQDVPLDKVIVQGTTVPTNGTAWYAKGCLFIDTDVAGWTGWLYCNKWTRSSCAFTLVTQA